jgi:hypothetical protein
MWYDQSRTYFSCYSTQRRRLHSLVVCLTQTLTPLTLMPHTIFTTHRYKRTLSMTSPLARATYIFTTSPPHVNDTAEPLNRPGYLRKRTYSATTTKRGSTTRRNPLRPEVNRITYIRIYVYYLHNNDLTSPPRTPQPES